MRYDTAADVLRIGKSSATVGEVVAALTQVARLADEKQELSAGVLVKLTESEHRILKQRAAESGTSLQDYARAVFVKYSVL